MFRWMRERRQRAHLAEVARMLQVENERLRDEVSGLEDEIEQWAEMVEVLSDSTRRIERIRDGIKGRKS
jgi:methyl-accepting chemotaxis protein